ncbi:sepiapterin reductase a [Periophthalmus magnuspinnatus]|uniref:sepiapterin reductase a n=1 Tax=Periophthalmus magnuspinnatus TaxID=409849 RepID=UPI00145BABB5|nr:sepiapterin reductase a [Periophthalmus magnuspinnatus]
MHPPDLGRALCIITGASRGFGRTIAQELSHVVKPGSAFVLVARSGDDLRTLQAELTDSEAGRAGLRVQYVEADLGLPEGLERVTTAAKEVATDLIDHVLLVNNAGSLGDISGFTKSFTDMAEVNSYLSLNVSSFLCLTAQILQAFPQRPGLRRSVVNISSLCALKPFSSWVLYCSGKAARDMIFRVLAEEEPDLRVLNYAPGPLDTDMQLEARSKSGDMLLRKSCNEMFSKGQLLSCEESCGKLMKLLMENTYTSGAHIDFYDI